MIRVKQKNNIYKLYETYEEYLLSPDWQKKREYTIKREKGLCQGCGGKAQAVHHLTYENIGNELYHELIAICNKCHRQIHAKKKNIKKYRGIRKLISLIEYVESIEILKALMATKNNKTRAAEILGISRFTLIRRIKKHSRLKHLSSNKKINDVGN